MRTTVMLDKDVAAAVSRLRHERQIGVSEAVNDLVRAGLTVRPDQRRFQQRSFPMGLRIDVTNIAEALEILEGPGAP